jgi:hypothetical protein
MIDPIDSTPNNNQMTVSSESATYLRETGSWGNFLAIVGFIGVGLIVLLALFASSVFALMGANAGIPVGLISGIYLCIAALYFFPVLYLYKFSAKIKEALQKKDTVLLEGALENLKSLFKFMGITTAVMLGLYALIIVGTILGGALF